VWHKSNPAPTQVYPAKFDTSFIVWTAKKSVLYNYQHYSSCVFSVPKPMAGCMAKERFVDAGGKALHPAQGPLALYLRLLAPLADLCPGQTVVDPYMGTGTTLRAAKDLGFKAIGIEIEERYCEMAARRLDQGVLNFV
jgi:DNA modification methylase